MTKEIQQLFVFVDESNRSEYEAFVERHERGHFLQSLHWAEFKGGGRGVMSISDDGKVRGAMLLLPQRAPMGLGRFLYSPRGPVCDNDVCVMRDLHEGAMEYAKEIGAYMLSLDPDVTDEEFAGSMEKVGFSRDVKCADTGILQPLSVFRINVGGMSDEELIMSFHSKARYSVRASLKSGAVCRISESAEDLKAFQALLVETAARDNFTPRPIEYFQRMFKILPEDMRKLFVVELEGQVIAGSVLIKYGDKTWHLYGASSGEHTKELPNFLMQWEMMRYTIAEGCKVYDMRGVAGERDKSAPLEGLMRFKKRFGGELITFIGRLDAVYDKKKKRRIDTLKKIKGLLGR